MSKRNFMHGVLSTRTIRAKFKSTDVVEVVVIDSATQEVYVLQWDYSKSTAAAAVTTKKALEKEEAKDD